MSIFEIVKDSVDIVDAAVRYGLDVNRRGKSLCPFHNDRNPSLSFYRDRRSDEQRYKCFSCQAGGDVIDLVGFLANTAPLETVRELNQTYNLRLDVDKPVPSAEVQRRKRLQQEKLTFEDWKWYAANTLGEYFHLLRKWREIYAPRHPDDIPDPRFMESLRELDYIDYISYEVFICDPKGAMSLYQSGFIDRIARRLKTAKTEAGINPSGITFPFEVNEHRLMAA